MTFFLLYFYIYNWATNKHSSTFDSWATNKHTLKQGSQGLLDSPQMDWLGLSSCPSSREVAAAVVGKGFWLQGSNCPSAIFCSPSSELQCQCLAEKSSLIYYNKKYY